MLPKFVYEMLPTICVVAGAVTGVSFDNSLGKYAALLLVLAGVCIFNLRLNARS